MLKWGNNGPPTQICKNGEIISSPIKIADSMNNNFVNKIKKLKEKITKSPNDPCSKLKEKMKDRKFSFNFRAVRPN